jgi:D-aminopeptidase
MLAFSTANRLPVGPGPTVTVEALLDGAADEQPYALSSIFAATIEAVEEAVANAMFMATTTRGVHGNVLHALPLDRTLEVLERHGRLKAGVRGADAAS